jgi:2-succinyl-5-enolpyruvyl-6-hydroxy-3-cyclohexene-1-carboxylate synthase
VSHDADLAGGADAGAPGTDVGCSNLAWALALLEGMVAGGVRALIISPGARSTPLVIAGQRLERAGRMQLVPILDERSAGFFALGLARATLRPVGLVATSGSAPAHWYPAVIEASESGLPLLLLSADRPPRLHGWGANQTIDQTRLFGTFVREFHDPGLPRSGASALKAQRALGRRVAQVSQGRRRGPVHINLPFDEPLVPADTCSGISTLESVPGVGADVAVSADIAPDSASQTRIAARLSGWPAGRGLIVCGPGAEQATPAACPDRATLADSLPESVWRCADTLALPVLVDPLSGLRTGPGSKARISAYDAILRNQEAARALRPDWVLRLGAAPVSKRLGEWLQGIPSVLVSPGGRWSDPGQDALIQLELPAAAVCDALVEQKLVTPDQSWLARWCGAEQRAWALLEASLGESAEGSGQRPLVWCEGDAIRALRCAIPDQEALLCANSMPIRQLDTWWRGGGAQVALLGNRGASGIDGYLSTLAGLSQAGLRCWGLTGDLSFCHDLSGLLLAARLDRPLLVLNNNGGHIFDYLPQRGLEGLERFWHTPQPVQIQALAETAGIAHVRAEDGVSLGRALTELGGGPGVIEVRIDPEASRRSHLDLWARIAQARLLDL